MEYGYVGYTVRNLPLNVLGGSFAIISYKRELDGKSIHTEIRRCLFTQYPNEMINTKELAFDSNDITDAPVEITMELILDQVAEITKHDIAKMLEERSKEMGNNSVALLQFKLEKHFNVRELLTSFIMRGIYKNKIEILQNATTNKLLQQDLDKILHLDSFKTLKNQTY